MLAVQPAKPSQGRHSSKALLAVCGIGWLEMHMVIDKLLGENLI